MVLVIGNKRLSSWSLRPWLLMKQFGIPFEEKLILLDQPETRAEIFKYSEAAKVPVLVDGSIHIWESMAIAEYLNEKYPEKQMWPSQPPARALAFLFGDFSIADAMFAPVVNRFMTYDVKTERVITDYIATVRNLPVHQEWIQTGLKETYEAPFH